MFKKSTRYEGELRSLKKGSEVRWPVNLCASCNNARSQPFDRAHDRFEDFVVANVDEMMRWCRLRWQDLFGARWEQEAADLARYFGKQLGCLLDSYDLSVPVDLIEFLDGAPECPSVKFSLARNWRAGYQHTVMRDEGSADGLSSFVGILPSMTYETDGRFTGLDYGYHLGYVWVAAAWREGAVFPLWTYQPEIDLPLINGSLRDRLAWRRMVSLHRRMIGEDGGAEAGL
ncbi:hypothetical protein GCM10022199_04500 [Marihabitans asiaticum]|uniref:Uncharacterized protein n=1 Tax=Marihabitans asiaticum TaxID=415218 RepID=A0A560WE24_9MICO|nr:hypothetical protein [Marihabitans asiaticum]TWD15878.1 hypothetical protein FB557_1414 [Marihabitans asiaticum]